MPLLYSKGYIPSDTRFVKVSETELYALRWPVKETKQYRKIQPKEGEIWRPIPELSGVYSVSNHGRIKSTKIMKNGRVVEKAIDSKIGKEKKRVRLTHGNIVIHEYVSRIVLRTFNPVPDEHKMRVIYLDGDILNNSLENLKWSTHKESLEHEKAIGGRKPWLKKRERIHPITGKTVVWSTRFSDVDVCHMIRLYKQNVNISKIADIFDCSKTQVMKFVSGQIRPELQDQFDAILQRETNKKKKD